MEDVVQEWLTVSVGEAIQNGDCGVVRLALRRACRGILEAHEPKLAASFRLFVVHAHTCLIGSVAP